MNSQERYFLAIVPPSPVYEQVMGIKTYFRDQYNCKAPLRSPAHITLHMPFLFSAKKEITLIESLAMFSDSQNPFSIRLDGFDAFAPRVIFVAVEENPSLRAFQKSLSIFARKVLGLFHPDHKDRGYHPHMTVAFRDLKKALFPQAWREFEHKPFAADFEVRSFWLLKHDGKKWLTHHEFFLSD